MSAGCVIGVDLGGTKLLAGVVDERLDVHHRAFRRSCEGRDSDALLRSIVDAVEEARQAAGGEVLAVGFGIPSLVDHRRGFAAHTVHLPLRDVAFRDLMAERLGLPVVVDNDANAALVAEHRRGAARGAGTAALLTLGTGIGGAIVADGRLVHGAHGGAGEWGHMVVDIDGPACTCGNVGCLEMLVSGSAIARDALRVASTAPDSALGRALAAGQEITGMLTTELAHDGDAAARDVIALAGTRLGVGIANVVNILNPEVVAVGGGVVAAGDLLLEPARRVVAERALRPSRDQVRIVPTRFGDASGMIGAALLAMELVGLGGEQAAA
ncbi:MAG TPA: ROK family protein [Baekduia sp.]|nr:ROK family protein [Baekduia sp.]